MAAATEFLPYLNVTTEIEGFADDPIAERLRFRSYPTVVFMDAAGTPVLRFLPESRRLLDLALKTARRNAAWLEAARKSPDEADARARSLMVTLSVTIDGQAAARLAGLAGGGKLSAETAGFARGFLALQTHRDGASKWRHGPRARQEELRSIARREDYRGFKEGRILEDEAFPEYRDYWASVGHGAVEAKDVEAAASALRRLEGLLAEFPGLRSTVDDLSSQLEKLGHRGG